MMIPLSTPTLQLEQYQYGTGGIVLNSDPYTAVTQQINEITNPSFEINSTTGWSGNAIAVSTTQAFVGANALSWTPVTGNAIVFRPQSSLAGHTYQWAAWVYPTASTTITPKRSQSAPSPGASAVDGPAVVCPANTWTRVTQTFTTPAGETATNVILSSSTLNSVIYVDACMFREGSDDMAYFDGDTPSSADGRIQYEWYGTPHASFSRRIGKPAILSITDIESVEGLDAAPVRSQTHDREGVDGGYVDAVFETIRTVTLSGTAYTGPGEYESYMDSLKAQFAPTPTPKPLYYMTDAGPRAVIGKSMGLNYTKDQGRRIGKTAFQVQIQCEDPRIYSPTPIVKSTTLVSTLLTGRGYNKIYPYGYGAASTQSQASVELVGNRSAPAVIRIVGPVVNPAVIYDNTGTRFSFSVTLADGEYIEIDLDTKSVIRNGSSNVRNLMTLTGSWFLLSTGPNSFRFAGTQSPPTPLATMTVTAYSAWR